MSREDFETRWLTLGTESKVVSAVTSMKMPRIDSSKPIRPVLGEKGIGRLAIAVIGPQVLVLTRTSEGDLTAAFVQWSLFQSPGINLDQIEIPIRTFGPGVLPSKQDVREMLGETKANLERLKAQLSPSAISRITEELKAFEVDPPELDAMLGSPSLLTGTGTQFFVMPADHSVAANIDERTDGDGTTALRKMLLGFTNTMTPDHVKPANNGLFQRSSD